MKHYVRTLWIDNKTPINACNLNKLENGLYEATVNALAAADILQGEGIRLDIIDKKVKISAAGSGSSIKIEIITAEQTSYANDTIYFLIDPTTSILKKIIVRGEETDIPSQEEITAQIQAAIQPKADKTELNAHTGNGEIHVTGAEKTSWNNKVDESLVYKKTETYTRTEIEQKIAEAAGVSFVIVDVLPETGQPNKIYLVPKTHGEVGNVYTEWIWINKSGTWGWEKIGETAIDLSEYAKKTEVEAGLAGKADKTELVPLATKTEVETGLSGKVDKVAGKGLSTNDYSNADYLKVFHSEDYAQRNVIEIIKLNGEVINPGADKDVNIVPEISDISGLQESLNTKVETTDPRMSDSRPASDVSLSGNVLTVKGTSITISGATYSAGNNIEITSDNKINALGYIYDKTGNRFNLGGNSLVLGSHTLTESDLEKLLYLIQTND